MPLAQVGHKAALALKEPQEPKDRKDRKVALARQLMRRLGRRVQMNMPSNSFSQGESA